jgi:tetratricopeptide (TPR) repeat protein
MSLTHDGESSIACLSRDGYWAAWAAQHVTAGEYADAIQLCKERLAVEPQLLSARIAYGVALARAGQAESAKEQFFYVLSTDPDNLVALKHLGDIAFAEGDEFSAMAKYERILEIDPYCRGVASDFTNRKIERTHTVTLVRPEEPARSHDTVPLRAIPFYTETMGDLYMAQGYHRLAATVYRVLHDRGRHPRLQDKLLQAEEKIKSKE